MLKEMNINVKYAFLFLGFVRELLSNTTRSAKFWSVMLGYWGLKRLTIKIESSIRTTTNTGTDRNLHRKGDRGEYILLDDTIISHNREIFYSYVTSGVKKSSSMVV
jgi:hypothetical protein